MTLPSSGPLTLSDIQTEFGGTNPIGMNEYYAGGGLVPAGTTGTYGAVPSSGALSVQNFYGTSAVIPAYIEEVFSTYLYTGNVTARSITNEIDLAGKGGLVWIKSRAVASHYLQDTARGVTYTLSSDSTSAQAGPFTGTVTSANANGFSLGTSGLLNGNGVNYASWTFRKQPKFFDVVTFNGNGSTQTISHNLGSAPGCIMVKCITEATDWWVYHRSLGTNQVIKLNTTAAQDISSTAWNNTAPTSTVFSVGNNGQVNSNGQTYVAYLFAHNAGGFGLTGTDNVISCGSLTTDGSGNATVSLGYEPQWVLMKKTSGAESWMLFDNMRGLIATQGPTYSRKLVPNLTNAESDGNECSASSTGFNVGGVVGGATYVYVAIRRGPMKVPTSGTSVFEALSYQGTGVSSVIATTNVADLFTAFRRNDTANAFAWATRLIGANAFLTTQSTNAQNTQANTFTNIGGKTITVGSQGEVNQLDWNYIGYYISRAPSFMDVVCYTGTGSNTTYTHNLGVAPELIIFKTRGVSGGWRVICNFTSTSFKQLELQLTDAAGDWNYTDGVYITAQPTNTTFKVGTNTNTSATTFVTYLFATCAGVSKVGSYTGTAATQTINCGFTTGARFILIKRTDSTGNWYIWDSTRGITSTNDPYFLANSYSAEVTNTNYVDAYSTGFQVRSAASTTVNVNGASYIFLAIA